MPIDLKTWGLELRQEGLARLAFERLQMGGSLKLEGRPGFLGSSIMYLLYLVNLNKSKLRSIVFTRDKDTSKQWQSYSRRSKVTTL